MSQYYIVFLITCLSQGLLAQRGFYSGARPQGYKDRYTPQTDQSLIDRFETNSPTLGSNTQTQRPAIPINAHGDQGLIDRLNQLPRDKQPFWFINYQQLEAQRGQAFPALTQNNVAPVQNTNNQLGGLNSGFTNNQLGGLTNNPLNNRFSAQMPSFNSPYPIVQGVPGTLGF